jgi:DNA-binding response OmpR family regulator
MGQSRILIVEEGSPAKTLCDLPECAMPQTSQSTEWLCEAQILAPGLILLNLTGAAARHRELWQRLTDQSSANNLATFELSITRQGSREGAASLAPEPTGETLAEMVEDDPPQVATAPIPTNSAAKAGEEPVLQMGPVRIDRHGHWAYLHEKKLHLTPTEFRLLECFLCAPGRAFTRSQLVDVSISNSGLVLDRTVDVHIRSLRLKLGQARNLIETVRGVGYRFREVSDLDQAG